MLPAILAGSALIGSFALAGTASAAGTGSPPQQGTFQRPAIVGTVSAVNGDTITVTARSWQRGTSATQAPETTYTVNASGATVMKDGAAASTAAIATCDHVAVSGSVTGTTVAATSIRDGSFVGSRMHGAARAAAANPVITGNGDPIIGGTVSAVNGDTLTVTTKSGTAYTVAASSATVAKAGTASSLSSVATGDQVIVQGTVNGTSVTASSVLDQGAPRTATNANANSSAPAHRGFFGTVGGLFSRLFGFF